MSELYVRNRQRSRPINTRLLRNIALRLLAQIWPGESRIGILLVGAREMARLNEAYLGHAGSTDVLAFGYAAKSSGPLHGEVFICVDEAIRQARRFRTTWEKEVVRYLVHGLLHFQGHEDSTAAKRKRMKRAENALVRSSAREFSPSQLSV